MPLIQVNMLEGRTPEQKRALLQAITQAVHGSIGAPLESIRVWIHEFPDTDFIAAGEMANDRRARLEREIGARRTEGPTSPKGAAERDGA